MINIKMLNGGHHVVLCLWFINAMAVMNMENWKRRKGDHRNSIMVDAEKVVGVQKKMIYI